MTETPNLSGVLEQDRARLIAEVIEAALGGEHHDLAVGIAAQLVELMPDRPTGKTLKSEADAVQRYIDLDAAALKARRQYTESRRAEMGVIAPATLHKHYERWQQAEDARNRYMTLLGVS